LRLRRRPRLHALIAHSRLELFTRAAPRSVPPFSFLRRCRHAIDPHPRGCFEYIDA
jgi:hypothetical protein